MVPFSKLSTNTMKYTRTAMDIGLVLVLVVLVSNATAASEAAITCGQVTI